MSAQPRWSRHGDQSRATIGAFDALAHEDGLWQLFLRGDDGLAIAADRAGDRASAQRAAVEMAARLGAGDAPEEARGAEQLDLFGDEAGR